MQNPGATEVDFAKPACGQAGKDMDYNFIPLAGLERGKTVTVSNVLKCRWNESNDLPWDIGQAQAVQHCTSRHLTVPPGTRLIIAQGKLAFEYLNNNLRDDDGRPSSITNWRGFLLPEPVWVDIQGKLYRSHEINFNLPQALGRQEQGAYQAVQVKEIPRRPVKVFTILHTADLYRNPQMEEVTSWDWLKVGRVLDGEYPSPLPPRIVTTRDNLDEVRRWFLE